MGEGFFSVSDLQPIIEIWQAHLDISSLLGKYLNFHPKRISFQYLPHGKPILDRAHQTTFEFNVSHSHHLALYAFSPSQPVGIDLELIRPLPSALSLAQRFFTPREFAYLTSLPPQQQEAIFFQFWTAKEAYLKATGEGLIGLQNIELAVSATDGNQFDLVKGREKIQLYSFTPEDNFIATVASLHNDGLNLVQQTDRAPDTSNKWIAADRCSFSESLETQLVFHNWDE